MDLKSQIAEYSKRIEIAEQNIVKLKATLSQLKALKKALEKVAEKDEALKEVTKINS